MLFHPHRHQRCMPVCAPVLVDVFAGWGLFQRGYFNCIRNSHSEVVEKVQELQQINDSMTKSVCIVVMTVLTTVS